MPATTPNPTCETTNQSQSIRWFSTGLMNSENAVEQTGPQEGRDDAAQQNRPPRKHRQHRAVEQADQQRRDEVNRAGDDQARPE